MIHIFSEEFEKGLTVFLRLIPMADEQGRHDHQPMFLQKLHGLAGLLHRMALSDIFEHRVRMIFEPHHELINTRLSKAIQEIFIPDHQIGPGLQPKVLIRLPLEHLLDEADALLLLDIEGIVADVKNSPVVFFFQEFELIGDPFGTPVPPGLFIKGRFRAEGTIPRTSP